MIVLDLSINRAARPIEEWAISVLNKVKRFVLKKLVDV